jgi:hypothetical protein
MVAATHRAWQRWLCSVLHQVIMAAKGSKNYTALVRVEQRRNFPDGFLVCSLLLKQNGDDSTESPPFRSGLFSVACAAG